MWGSSRQSPTMAGASVILAMGGICTHMRLVVLAIGSTWRLYLLLGPCMDISNQESGAVHGPTGQLSSSLQ